MAGVMCIFTLTLVSVLYIFQGSSILARQKARDDLGSILAMVAKQRDQMTKDDPQALAHHLSLTMPAQVSSSDVTIRQEDDLTRFQIRIPGISSSYFLDYPMAGNCEGIRDMTYVASEDGGIIELSCDGVYVMSKTVKGDHLYLDLDRPSSVFDAMFVVDAGHGGKDSGAIAGGIEEKNLNLAIVQKIREKFKAETEEKDTSYVEDQFSVFEEKGIGKVGVFYTRCSDKSVGLEERVSLANRLPADLFLSVHINSTATGRASTINGTAVMYKVSDSSGRSKEFSSLVLDKLLADLKSKSKGLIAGDEIYIIRTANMPVALAEIGFITNDEERKRMASDGYQEKCAGAICSAMEEYLQKVHK